MYQAKMKPVSILQTEVRPGDTVHEFVLVTTATGEVHFRMSVRQAEDEGGSCARSCSVHRNRCYTHVAVWNTWCKQIQPTTA